VSTVLDMFLPQTAEQVGTQRVERIANEPYDAQIRNSGLSVLDAMFSAAKDRVIELASGTAVGQDIIATAKRQQIEQGITQYGPLILIGLLILVFFVGRAVSRG